MAGTVALTRALSRLYPWEAEASEELADALAFLDYPCPPEEVVRAGYGAGLVSALPVLSLAFVLPDDAVLVLVPFLLLLVPLGVVHAYHSAPHLLAALRRTRALGETPDLVGRAVLRMKIQPALENAARFAADSGRGPLADSLLEHVERSIGTPRTGVISFAEEWSDRFPALRRSAHLLETAQDAPEAERNRTLDRSLQAVLDGTRDQMADFTARIQGATTALFAFGIVLPLALIALVPAAMAVGDGIGTGGGGGDLPVSIWHFVAFYNVLLPAALVVVSAWLLTKRPVAFPPPEVTRDHPDVPDRIWLPVAVGLVGGAVAYVAVLLFAPDHLAAVAAAGVGLGVALMAYYRPILEVRNYVRDVEEHLVDALYLVGKRVSEKEAVESAIEHAGDRVPAETGEVFAEAAGVQRRLQVGVEEAFLGEYGALDDVPSPRARSTASLLAIAADEGRPAGRAVVSMADHLDELKEVEDRTRRELETVTRRLENTAAFFGPMIAGATVGMSAGIAERSAEISSGSALRPDHLGVVVGVFVITLCCILPPLSLALRHGLDRSLIGYHVGRALVFAVPTYVASVVAVGLIMGPA